jgi:hypothetical protein
VASCKGEGAACLGRSKSLRLRLFVTFAENEDNKCSGNRLHGDRCKTTKNSHLDKTIDKGPVLAGPIMRNKKRMLYRAWPRLDPISLSQRLGPRIRYRGNRTTTASLQNTTSINRPSGKFGCVHCAFHPRFQFQAIERGAGSSPVEGAMGIV